MIEIVLPLPHKNLSPNARCHWAVKSKSVKKARNDSRIATLHGMTVAGYRARLFWQVASVQATFYFRDKRRRDKDNAAASLKSYGDGMKDAGLIYDDCGLTWLPPVFSVDKANPRVVLRVTTP